MGIRLLSVLALSTFSVLSASAQVTPPPVQIQRAASILDMPEQIQIEYVKWYLNQGVPPDGADPVTMLVLNRSTLILPLIEAKIEEVLKAPNPADCFTNKAADPKVFPIAAASLIAYAGDTEAFKEIGKLIELDPARFARFARNVLGDGETRRNPFALSYTGLELGNSIMDKEIVSWIQQWLGDFSEAAVTRAEKMWGEALVDRYGGPPSEAQWASDPIASRLDPKLIKSVRDDVYRFALEALTNRNLKKK